MRRIAGVVMGVLSAVASAATSFFLSRLLFPGAGHRPNTPARRFTTGSSKASSLRFATCPVARRATAVSDLPCPRPRFFVRIVHPKKRPSQPPCRPHNPKDSAKPTEGRPVSDQGYVSGPRGASTPRLRAIRASRIPINSVELLATRDTAAKDR